MRTVGLKIIEKESKKVLKLFLLLQIKVVNNGGVSRIQILILSEMQKMSPKLLASSRRTSKISIPLPIL